MKGSYVGFFIVSASVMFAFKKPDLRKMAAGKSRPRLGPSTPKLRRKTVNCTFATTRKERNDRRK